MVDDDWFCLVHHVTRVKQNRAANTPPQNCPCLPSQPTLQIQPWDKILMVFLSHCKFDFCPRNQVAIRGSLGRKLSRMILRNGHKHYAIYAFRRYWGYSALDKAIVSIFTAGERIYSHKHGRYHVTRGDDDDGGGGLRPPMD